MRRCPFARHAAASLLAVAVGCVMAGPGQADEPAPARDLLALSRSLIERLALEALLDKLVPPRHEPSEALPTTAPATNTSEAATADELARQLAAEAAARPAPAPVPPVAADAGPQPPISVAAPAKPAAEESFTPLHASAGQPVARMPDADAGPAQPDLAEPKAAEPVSAAAIESTPHPPPVPPGIHLSPLRPLLPADPADPAMQPRPPPSRQAAAADAAAPTTRPAAKTFERSTTPSRRGQCTEILQRATLGDLTEEDRVILKTQCR